jgi:predicted RNase H-like HicB family nuclease
MSENSATIITGIAFLTVFIVRDNGSYMAKCPELDLVTEMDSKEDALKAIVEMIMEYAEDYKAQEEIYLRSPNRSHHKSYIDAVIACRDEWTLNTDKRGEDHEYILW